jgi:hypothetical protein
MLHNTECKLSSCFGSETWVTRNNGKRRRETASDLSQNTTGSKLKKQDHKMEKLGTKERSRLEYDFHLCILNWASKNQIFVEEEEELLE